MAKTPINTLSRLISGAEGEPEKNCCHGENTEKCIHLSKLDGHRLRNICSQGWEMTDEERVHGIVLPITSIFFMPSGGTVEILTVGANYGWKGADF